LANPKWSPDGKQLAVLFTENAVRVPGPLEAVTPLSGVVGEHIYEQRLALVDVETGAARQISPADMYVYEYDWAPDGRRLVYTAAPGEGDNNWYIAGLYTIGASSGSAQLILKPSMQIAMPRWSPDSQQIVFIGGLMSDEGSVGGEVFSIRSGGGDPRNLTPGRRSSPAWIRWLPSSKRLLVTENMEGGSAISRLDPRTGQMETLWRGEETIFTNNERMSVSVANDERTLSLIRTSWRRRRKSGPA
jgi:Tol biopolymer transport system component